MAPSPIILGTHEPYSVGERQRVLFTLDPSQHTYVIGASGSGKTHLLRNILIQMIARGDGVGFLDPYGDTAEELLDHIPPGRTRDVCYFNLADLRFPVAWNPLASVPTDRQRLGIEDIVAALRNLFGNGWGYQTERILRNCIGALIAAENTSLLGIRRLLIDPDYRSTVLKHVTDPLGLSFWYNEFETWEPKLRLPAIAPLQNKLGALFGNPIDITISSTVCARGVSEIGGSIHDALRKRGHGEASGDCAASSRVQARSFCGALMGKALAHFTPPCRETSQ